ncbi:NlpC/P60 family protein [Streptomyces sp. NPDC051133]|uniref:C40 family peptidase n=1 Tax=Streptomyces sp. NPDC051133 TaxID=3155521 RepID=UPI003437E583
MAPESRDEVRQRIDSLYDQAENATGNYNATRAMAAGSRSRGVPLAKRSGRRPDPSLDEMTRQWFDAARAKVGPTVPAVLPADRLPGPASAGRSRDRGRGGLPAGEREAPGTALPARALERAPERALPELPAGPAQRAVAALDSGRSALPELPSTAPALPGRAATRGGAPGAPETLTPGATTLAALGPAETAVLPAQGIPARRPRALPGAAAPGRPSPADSKTSNRRKLTAARDLLSRHTAQPAAAVAEITAASITDTGSLPPYPSTTAMPATDTGALPTFTYPTTTPATPTPTPAPADYGSTYAQPAATARMTDTGTLPPYPGTTATPATDTGALPTFSYPTTTATPTPDYSSAYSYPATVPGAVTDTGPLPHLGASVDTGPLPHVAAAPAADAALLPLPAPAPVSPRAQRAARAIAFARAQVGKPCVWGATGPDSYDCSSLTQAAWKAAGVTLPRNAHQQALAGGPVTLAGLEPGDLVLFFDDDRHVGLHVGDGMMVHAPGPGASIREESIYGAGEAAIHRIVRPA